ncbi:MAG: AAA family ATPase [Bacteroidia bacterium]|nr:AAA family ATPase [Bacteroidia bacterium]
MHKTWKIAVTGPESTGKSDLSLALQAVLEGSVWVPEYSRIYLEKYGPSYTCKTLDTIAAGQWQSIQDALASEPRILIADTEMTVMKVWSEFCFGHCSPFILDLYARQDFDLYLLCDADLPWSYDPLREHPEKRGELLEWYKRSLETAGRNYVLISGSGEERLQNALAAVRHKTGL